LVGGFEGGVVCRGALQSTIGSGDDDDESVLWGTGFGAGDVFRAGVRVCLIVGGAKMASSPRGAFDDVDSAGLLLVVALAAATCVLAVGVGATEGGAADGEPLPGSMEALLVNRSAFRG
jgi:hypothetical protein